MNLMNKLLLVFCLFTGFGTFCSCSNDDEEINDSDMIWDLAPINLKIIPVDQQGNYILQDFDDAKVTAIWRDNTYIKDHNVSEKPEPPTRAYPVTMYGLLSNDTCLVFGELDRELDYTDEQIVINWGDEYKSDTIMFNHKLTWVKGDKGYKVPESVFDIKLNGEPVDYKMRVVKTKK